AAAASGVTRPGARPAMLELLDAATLEALDAAGPPGGALLLAQADGPGADVEIDAIAAVLGRTATRLDVATDPRRADELVAVRRRALPAIERRGRVLIEDIAVPPSRLAETVTRIGELSARTGVPVFTFAHAGDGNLHPIVLTGQPFGDPGPVPADVTAVVDDIFRLALDLGGTITGEHGVGLLKRKWLAAELDAGAGELHRRIKAAFDPHSVLNPGKAL
ncbi:FAD-linked oxidase C-terminal domain-containing protein, partial [Dactylosporangium fulvum]|uniref:FAD-linked oxidase C-terminal domain-containing protein n=1 Tax=Dactylosporangium fulvum TaxID=53359 RepID=UPI0031D86957